ncbi:serine hydrolase domain-containing protein [Nocardia tengchongensis]|uniref:serine hydrolase domain-containing protein n=1 Tax=Nocardia tengchongensis TaxID=2055889 RepID=UPI00367CC0D3
MTAGLGTALVACTGSQSAGAADAGYDGPTAPPELKQKLQALADSARVVGCNVAAVDRDRTLFADAWGTARRGKPMTPVSTLNIGSVSKTITATAVLQLVAAGHFTLDTDVNDILANAKLYGPHSVRSPHHPDTPIRIRHLLTHLTPLTSPVGPNAYGYTYRMGAVPDPAEMGRWLHDYLTPPPRGWTYSAEVNFTKGVPGQAHQYSDVAYELAGHVVQAATGKYFADYCRDAILTPAGMTRSDFNRDKLSEDNRAHPHAWFEDGVKKGMWEDFRNLIPHDIPDDFTGPVEYAPYVSSLVADGGLRSNAVDLARWARLWLNEGSSDGQQILPQPVATAALTNQVAPQVLAASESPVSMIAQGYAWMRLAGDADGIWQHAGSEFGTASYVMIDTKRGVGAAVVCNTEVRIDNDPRPKMLQLLLDAAANS